MKYIHIGETGVGSLSATGQLMQSLFDKSECILLSDICNLKNANNKCSLDLAIFKDSSGLIDVNFMIPSIRHLCPDFIFVRLGSNAYTNLSSLKNFFGKPLIVSIMDDIGDDDYIREALSVADKIWFISDLLMNKYKKYSPNAYCFVSANGVSPLWGRKDNLILDHRKNFRINFSGNLNQNQSLDAILFLCSVIRDLRTDSYPISLHIFSRMWEAQAKHFSPFAGYVTLNPLVPMSQYRNNFLAYSATFFGYGASPDVINYIRYSVSNKLPEVLCSGLPSIGYGSTNCESLRLFRKYRPDYFVDASNPDSHSAMINLIKSIYEEYYFHVLKARHESRELTKIFDIDLISKKFAQHISS